MDLHQNDEIKLPHEETLVIENPYQQKVVFPGVQNYLFYHICFNIRSLRKNFDNFLIYLNFIDPKPNIILLTEIWIYENEKQNYNIAGYQSYFDFRDDGRSGGVAFYIKNDIKVEKINVNFASAESLFLSCYKNGITVMLLGIYRSHAFPVPVFTNELRKFLQGIKNERNVVLSGDVNIDILKTDDMVRDYIDLLSVNGFESYIQDVTRPSNNDNGGSCLDHLFVRNNLKTQINSAIIKCDLPDHYGTALVIGSNTEITNENQNVKKIQIDFQKLKENLNLLDWGAVHNENCITKAYSNFTNILTQEIQSCSKTITYNAKRRPIKPWITEGIIVSIRKRDKMFKKLKNEPFNTDLKKKI